MLKLLLTTLFLFVSFSSYAASDKQVSLVGYVLSYGEKEIKIESEEHAYKVNRKLYDKPLKLGHRISIEMNEDEFKKVMKTGKKISAKEVKSKNKKTK